MATSKSKPKQAPADTIVHTAGAAVITLADIIASGANGTFTTPDVYGPLVEAGFVEINAAMTDASGGVATRATLKGIESMNAPTTKTAGKFAIDSGIALPAISGRGKGGEVYPFDKLEVLQSFFVANSEGKPNAAKSLASTVSSATARYAVPSPDGATHVNKAGATVPTMVPTRKFVVRSVEENGVAGARIWRTA